MLLPRNSASWKKECSAFLLNYVKIYKSENKNIQNQQINSSLNPWKYSQTYKNQRILLLSIIYFDNFNYFLPENLNIVKEEKNLSRCLQFFPQTLLCTASIILMHCLIWFSSLLLSTTIPVLESKHSFLTVSKCYIIFF